MTMRADSTRAGTAKDLVRRWSRETPDQVAILAPGSPALTYGELHRRLDRWTDALVILGLSEGARIGIAIPAGPELAVALLAVSSTAACAPLRPDSPPAQLAREAAGLGLDLLVTAVDRAGELRDTEVPAVVDRGSLLASARTGGAGGRPAPRPDDIALLLRTSGTTGQPKRVPLSKANLFSAAHNIRRSLRLTAGDRCLNVMPLWHVHGLVAGLLASLAAGGSAVCPPEFSAAAFPDWLGSSGATWYTAAPAIHQAVLEVIADSGVPPHRLRFVRSSSSRLPSRLAARLEETFDVPTVEAYGMTEATHQIAATPLPPADRKRGSVGIGTDVAITILGERGEHLSPGTEGEIAIRGASVFGGYEDEASASFLDGWFRTGDRGHLDADGHLYITGRIKEMINRGGETIAPREIDEVILDHPDIIDAASFAVPHQRLGETVAAAVVVRAGSALTETRLRDFISTRLSLSKIPARVTFVEQIPRSPTGKLRRAELDRLLTTAEASPARAPTENPVSTEATADVVARLAAAWATLLGAGAVAPDESLSALGSDSLLTARMVNRVEAWFGVRIPLVDLFLADTVIEQAELIHALVADGPDHTGDGGAHEPR